MITKTPAKKGGTTKVTFELDPGTDAQAAHVCGEFNDWSREETPLVRRKDGRLTATVTLTQGRAYRFKYLLDGERWENEHSAEGYADNEYGTKDSVIEL